MSTKRLLVAPPHRIFAMQHKQPDNIRKTFSYHPCNALILLLTILFCLQARAIGFAQRVTLNLTNAPLKQIFKEVEKQSPFRFIYTEEQLQLAKPATVNVQNTRVQELLTICFDNQPIGYVIVDSIVVIRTLNNTATELETDSLWTLEMDPLMDLLPELPEDTTHPILPVIKGRVTDEQGKPVEGVTITIKGTDKATFTDAVGAFTLQAVHRNASLVLTSINIEPYEISVNGRVNFTITVSNSIRQMKEVEVVLNTGYQEVNKERATGSFVKIDNELLNRNNSSDILQRLYNVTSSLNFQPQVQVSTRNQSAVTIRGISTIYADARPLIVVDGFPYQENDNNVGISVSNINPNDVESVTILRDAAAASIWGVNSGNGVIVITTKKGNFGQKAKVNFTTNVTFTEKPHLFSQPLLGSADYVELEKTLFDRGYYNNLISNNSTFPVLTPGIEILLQKRNGTISAAEADTRLNALKTYDIRNDIDKYVSQTTVQQQYALNVSGGSATFNYYASAGYNRNFNTNQFNSVRAGSDQITLRLENSFRPIRKLEFNTYINYVQSGSSGTSLSPTSFLPAGNGTAPYMRLVDNMGNALAWSNKFRSNYTDTVSYPALLDWHYVPLLDPKYVLPTLQRVYIRLGAGLKYQLMTGLNADIRYQYARGQDNNNTYYDPRSFFVRDLVNTYMSSISGGLVSYPVPNGGIITSNSKIIASWNLRGSFSLNRSWSQHTITAIAGAELGQVSTAGLPNTRVYGYDKETGGAINSLNFDSLFVTRPSGNRSRIPSQVGSYGAGVKRTVSTFGNAAWTFQKKYTLSASARLDGANAFGVKANQRIKPLWSAGMAWDISKENFYKLSWLPYLKFRTTYGYQGNMQEGVSGYSTINYINTNTLINAPSAILANPPNPLLRWERIKMINVSMDFANSSQRIRGSLEVYYKRGIDLIGAVPIDATTGVPSYTGNGASIKGKGIDLQLNTTNFYNRLFQWTTSINVSYNTDVVTAFNRNTILSGTGYVAAGGAPIIGSPLFSLYSYRWGGLNTTHGDPMGYLSDTLANYATIMTGSNAKSTDMIYHGRQNPLLYGNLLNTFRYSKFAISCNFTYKFGYYFRRPSVSYSSLFNSFGGNSDYLLRWQKPGDEQFTSVPSMPTITDANRENFYRLSSVLVEKGDHIRLTDIRLNYDLNRTNVKKLPFAQAQIYLYISNLGIIWRANRYRLDPDSFNGLQKAQRSLAVGVNVNF